MRGGGGIGFCERTGEFSYASGRKQSDVLRFFQPDRLFIVKIY